MDGNRWMQRAQALTRLGRFDEAERAFDASVDAFEADGDLAGLASARGNLGELRLRQGRYDEALVLVEAARVQFERLERSDIVAIAWHQIGIIQQEAGRLVEAEIALQNALRLRDGLANESDLAATVDQIGIVYQRMGRNEDAVPFHQRASRLREKTGSPEARFTSINNLASALQAAGRHEAAIRVVDDAASLFEKLEPSTPTWRTWNVAKLAQLALGDEAAARSAQRRAVAAYRRYRAKADAPTEGLAHLLATMTGQVRRGAVAAARAALPGDHQLDADGRTIIRAVHELLDGRSDAARGLLDDPGLHFGDLAELEGLVDAMSVRDPTAPIDESREDPTSDRMRGGDADAAQRAVRLVTMGKLLAETGDWENSLLARREAVSLLRLAGESSRARDLLATSLTGLAALSGDMGLREEALAAASEAVELRRALARSEPDERLDQFATSLTSLGFQLQALGRVEEALVVTRESVAIRRRLASTGDRESVIRLAAAINNVSGFLARMKMAEEALAGAKEAVGILRRLGDSDGASHAELAMCLATLGAILLHVGRDEEALDPTLEALEIYRNLAATRPDHFGKDLAGTLSNLGQVCGRLDRGDEALGFARGAVATFLALPPPQRRASIEVFAVAVARLGVAMARVGQSPNTDPLLLRAIEVLRGES